MRRYYPTEWDRRHWANERRRQRERDRSTRALADLLALAVMGCVWFFVWLFKLVIRLYVWLFKLMWKGFIYVVKEIRALLDQYDVDDD